MSDPREFDRRIDLPSPFAVAVETILVEPIPEIDLQRLLAAVQGRVQNDNDQNRSPMKSNPLKSGNRLGARSLAAIAAMLLISTDYPPIFVPASVRESVSTDRVCCGAKAVGRSGAAHAAANAAGVW